MELRVKAKHVVKPAEPTWSGTLPLSQLDQIGVITHTSVVYIYNKPSLDLVHDSSHNKVIDALKHSLSRVLVPFYPLAGRLHWVAGGRLELHCNAMGVELIEAESSLKVSDLGDLSDFNGFEDLTPRVDYEKPFHELPLFLVQLIWFQCGGIGLGISTSHVIADGEAGLNFIREWARLARGEPLEGSPYLDRRILDDRGKTLLINESSHVDHVEFFPTLPTLIGKADSFEEHRKETIATTLILTKSQVDELRKVANRGKQCDCEERPYGRFEAIAAHAWRCASKAREHKSEQMTCLCFCVDSRRRMNPPLPPRYFGNGIVDVMASSQAGELVSETLGHACRKIREAIMKVTDEYIRSMINFLKSQKSLSTYQDRVSLGSTDGVFNCNPNIGVASWLNLPIRGLDFGWGEEIFSGPGSHDFDGDIVILPGYKNDGSVVVVVGLQVTHMEKFKTYFYEDIC